MTVRRAYSLVELMTVLAVMGVLLPLVAGTFAAMYRLDASIRRDMAFTDSLTTLELQLRRDAHDARGIEQRDVGISLAMTGDEAIEWKASAGVISRERIVEGSVKQREQWPLPRDYMATWSSEKTDDRDWLKLTLTSEGKRQDHLARSIVITSEVRRFPSAIDKETQP